MMAQSWPDNRRFRSAANCGTIGPSFKGGPEQGRQARRFFSQLVGGGDDAEAASAEAVEYKGYAIRPACRREGAQWLTVGIISKSSTTA